MYALAKADATEHQHFANQFECTFGNASWTTNVGLYRVGHVGHKTSGVNPSTTYFYDGATYNITIDEDTDWEGGSWVSGS